MTLARHRMYDLPKRRLGVSFRESLIVIAIIAIATTLAIPIYQIYTIRAQIAQGLVLSGPHKRAMTEFHQDNGEFPDSNSEADLAAPGAYASKYVTSISVGGSMVSIEFGNKANLQLHGRTVSLAVSRTSGSVIWTCSSGGTIPDDHMPPACR